jgi:hypothetical protein
MINLPAAINPNDPKYSDKIIIRAEEVTTIAKRRLELKDSPKKRFATVYDQCLQEVQVKHELMDDWKKCKRSSLSMSSFRR